MSALEESEKWQEIKGLLSERPIHEIAARFGVRPGEIAAAMQRTKTARTPPGRPAKKRRRRRGKTEEELPPEAGDHLPPSRPGSKDELLARNAHLLGSMPDAQVASTIGVSTRTVAAYRKRHGIGAFVRGEGGAKPKRRKGRGGGRRSRIAEFEELLGQVPDEEIAQKAGVAVGTVRNFRTRKGIPAAGRAAKKPARAERGRRSRARTVTDQAGEYGWRVTLQTDRGELDRIVLAGDVAEATRRAAAAGLGEVVGLQRLARLL